MPSSSRGVTHGWPRPYDDFDDIPLFKPDTGKWPANGAIPLPPPPPKRRSETVQMAAVPTSSGVSGDRAQVHAVPGPSNAPPGVPVKPRSDCPTGPSNTQKIKPATQQMPTSSGASTSQAPAGAPRSDCPPRRSATQKRKAEEMPSSSRGETHGWPRPIDTIPLFKLNNGKWPADCAIPLPPSPAPKRRSVAVQMPGDSPPIADRAQGPAPHRILTPDVPVPPAATPVSPSEGGPGIAPDPAVPPRMRSGEEQMRAMGSARGVPRGRVPRRAGRGAPRAPPGVRVLGPGPPPQLHLRDPDCPLLVIAGYRPGDPTICLYHLPNNPANAPNIPRRGQVPPEVWRELDLLLQPGTTPAYAHLVLKPIILPLYREVDKLMKKFFHRAFANN